MLNAEENSSQDLDAEENNGFGCRGNQFLKLCLQGKTTPRSLVARGKRSTPGS
jgi:hypothetical protein